MSTSTLVRYPTVRRLATHRTRVYFTTSSTIVQHTDIVVPLSVDVSKVCQTAFHDVEAIVTAGLDVWHATAVGTVAHARHCAAT